MSDPYLALDRLTRHMREAFDRIDFRLDYHRERKNNALIVRYKGRLAKLEHTYAFERGRITARIQRLEQGPVVHKKRNRR